MTGIVLTVFFTWIKKLLYNLVYQIYFILYNLMYKRNKSSYQRHKSLQFENIKFISECLIKF